MASRCLEEERNSPPRSTGSTKQAPRDRAAKRVTGELALAVLVPVGPPQQTILGHLEPTDKQNLGSTCSSLRQARLGWLSEVTVTVPWYKHDVASLAAWLERHQVCLHLRIDLADGLADPLIAAECNDRLTALPSSLMISLAVRSSSGLPAAVSTLTALTRLISTDTAKDDGLPFSSVTNHLRPLTRLRHLQMEGYAGSSAEELLALPTLKDLQTLVLSSCSLEVMPQALSVLTQLTALDLSFNDYMLATASLASLQHLQQLDLVLCDLTAVPEQVAALTALTRLDLSHNDELQSGWQYLLPLTQLQNFGAGQCGLETVPEQLSALRALTHLSLSNNRLLGDGWQHLLPLNQLRDLDLSDCWLTTAPAQLSALKALTRLNLSENDQLGGGWGHLLFPTQLQDLNLQSCGLRSVPDQLSMLMALTRMDLSANRGLARGWQPLMPLTQLQDLDLYCCGLTAVPEQLSALTALTQLDLSGNMSLAGGWQHLLPLTQLRDLSLDGVPLPGGALPPELTALPRLRITVAQL